MVSGPAEPYSSLAAVYDRWVGREVYQRMLDFLHRWIPDGLEGKTVVDLCCGTGSLALLLAERRARVIGIDMSAEMLAIAKSRMTSSSLQAEFILADAASVNLKGRNADLVLCTFDSLNYFPSKALTALARNAYAALRPGGCFIGDINTPYKLLTVFGDSIYAEDHGDYSYTWRNHPGDGWIDFEIHLLQSPNNDKPAAETVEYHRQYAHEPSDLTQSLIQAGFLPAALFDAYEEGALGPQTQRLTFVAGKQL